MLATIKKLYEEKGKSRKLFIAGHSLGAALASIASARLAFVDDMHIAAIYTIGSPRYCGKPTSCPVIVRHSSYTCHGAVATATFTYSTLRPLQILYPYSYWALASNGFSSRCDRVLMQRWP